MVYSSGKKNDIALRFKIPPFLFTFGATVEKKSTDKKFTATNFEVLNYYHSVFFFGNWALLSSDSYWLPNKNPINDISMATWYLCLSFYLDNKLKVGQFGDFKRVLSFYFNFSIFKMVFYYTVPRINRKIFEVLIFTFRKNDTSILILLIKMASIVCQTWFNPIVTE